MPTTLADWLAHCERLHPKAIDLSLERVIAVRDRGAGVADHPLSADGGCREPRAHHRGHADDERQQHAGDDEEQGDPAEAQYMPVSGSETCAGSSLASAMASCMEA